jgi:hypothetical protein
VRRLNIAMAAAVLALSAGCTNDQTLLGTNPNGTFYQIDRMGRPLVVELYSPWAHHDAILRSPPGSDANQLFSDIGTFAMGTAGRSAAISQFLQDLFAGEAQCKIPADSRCSPLGPAAFPTQSNVLVADLALSGNASFLGIETGDRILPTGAINPHPTPSFGGRGLPDDVAAIELGLTFGSLVPQIDSKIPDDGKEMDGRNGTPDLANDNVTAASIPYGNAYTIGQPYQPVGFPYLGSAY